MKWFKKKKKKMNPIEEVVSVTNSISKQRVNKGLPYESIGFFKSQKIFYPSTMPTKEVDKLRKEARDICWKDIHEAELDFVHGYGVYTWDTPWMLIQEARKREAEEAALRDVEELLEREFEDDLVNNIEDEILEEELARNPDLLDDIVEEVIKDKEFIDSIVVIEDEKNEVPVNEPVSKNIVKEKKNVQSIADNIIKKGFGE